MGIDKQILEISEADLRALITDGVREGKTIEFKREINLADNDAQRKFFASVASFANTQGGDMVFGMNAKDSIPTDICPLPSFNQDTDLIRLRDKIRAHIEPKVYGFHFQPIPLAAGGHALVLRIPRTWVGAHMVTFQNDNRFYARDGNGRRPMDVGEVRMAFTSPETLPERLRRLRLDRLSAIASGDVPMPLNCPQVMVLHIAPVKALDALHECDLDAVATAEAKANPPNLMPIRQGCHAPTYDVDGILRMSQSGNRCDGYTKLFRSGLLEAIDCSFVGDPLAMPEPYRKAHSQLFWTAKYEKPILDLFPKWLEVMRLAQLEPPAFITLSFIGLSGRVPYIGDQFRGGGLGLRPIRHDPLMLPPTLIESLDVDAKTVILPLINRLWQACGMPRSFNFDENGNELR